MPSFLPTLGDSWPGRGPHEGHTVTAIDCWPWKIHVGDDTHLHHCSGRVRCTCGAEWDTRVVPPSPVHHMVAPGEALCVRAGETSAAAAWGQRLTSDPSAVTCRSCVEWAHA